MLHSLIFPFIASLCGRVAGGFVDNAIRKPNYRADLVTEAGQVWQQASAQVSSPQRYDPHVGQMQAHAGLLEAIARRPGVLIVEDGRFVRPGDLSRRFDLNQDDTAAIAAAMGPSSLISLAPMYHIPGAEFASKVSDSFEQLVLSTPDGGTAGTMTRRRLLAAQFTQLVARSGSVSLDLNGTDIWRGIKLRTFSGLVINVAGNQSSAGFALRAMIDWDQVLQREHADEAAIPRLDSWVGNSLPETDAAIVLFLCAMRRAGVKPTAQRVPLGVEPSGSQLFAVRSSVLPELTLSYHSVK